MEIPTKYEINAMSDSEMRKAYSSFRSVANKRLQRLQSQGLGRRGDYRFPTIKEIQGSNKMTVESVLSDVSKFLRSPRTTVSGEKKFIDEFKQTMTEKGYGDLVKDSKDVYKVIDFMDDLRERYSSKIFDSGDALDVLQQGQRLNIPKDMLMKNFDMFASNLDKMEKVRKSNGGAAFSQRRLNTLIKKWNW